MLNFLAWYIVLSLLGLLTFPLAQRLFPALPDRGYSVSRALGLLLWGFIFWLAASLGLIHNDLGGILLALAAVVALSVWALMNDRGPSDSSFIFRLSSSVTFIKSNLSLVFTIELLFLLAFAVMAYMRALNPEITTAGGEKMMELAFINATLRSESFPPHDPWLAGYAISYYYFGYVLAALIAKLTFTPGSLTPNLMLAAVFAMSAVGAYGVLYNLLAVFGQKHGERASVSLPLSGPFFLLIVSNLEGFLEMLHSAGIFWTVNADGSITSKLWPWLAMKNLSEAPAQPFKWTPDQFFWWWRASRVVHDYPLNGGFINGSFRGFIEIIDEFPFFSYLLGDLHPHVLAMPFALLAIAIALNIYLGGWRGETNLFGLRVPVQREGFLTAGVVLGGIAFLNTWDFPIYLALASAALVLYLVQRNGWSRQRLYDFLAFSFPVGVLGVLLYLPFYAGFQSQAGGILPNLVFPVRGAHLWIMFAPLLIPLFAYLIYLRGGEKQSVNWRMGLTLALGLIAALWAFSWLLAWIVSLRLPDLLKQFLDGQGIADLATLFARATARRLKYIGGLGTLAALIIFAIAFLSTRPSPTTDEQNETHPVALSFVEGTVHGLSSGFVILLILFGALLVLAPEFVYLRDQFGSRMNTIFKFYYQAWLMWSLAAAFGTIILMRALRGIWNGLFSIVFVVVLGMALTYPVLATPKKINEFRALNGPTLDGAAHLERSEPEDVAAIHWLQTAPLGVVAEANSVQTYSYYARVSTYSGQPSVLGWPGHEGQWRGGFTEQGSRAEDLKRLYSTNSWDEAQAIIAQYNIRFIYVGNLERSTYSVSERKFQTFLKEAFRQGNTVIYEVP